MKNRYLIALTYSTLFLLDVVTGMLASGNSETWESAYYFARDFQKWREVFLLVMIAATPVIAIGFSRLKLRFDLWDWLIFSVWLLSQTITVFDYCDNGNQRSVDIDYKAFTVVVILIWILKIVDIKWKQLSILLKIRR